MRPMRQIQTHQAVKSAAGASRSPSRSLMLECHCDRGRTHFLGIETSRMWKPLVPTLATHFTVIAPDLPGIGGSDVPLDGLDMTHAAIRIHDLVKQLGIDKAQVVGHDIGLMVAYAYAEQFPAGTERLVPMDAFLPGVAGWEAIYNNPAIWHFRFNGATPEALVEGRERIYFEHFWNDQTADKTHSMPEGGVPRSDHPDRRAPLPPGGRRIRRALS
jgi:pimeloyl-ACP methyl ester carboxylesterase